MSTFDKPTDPLEAELQSDILDFAQVRGWFAVKIESRSRRGMMDVYALRKGRHVWIEVKKRGEVPRPQQEKVAREMRAQGAEVYAVDNMEEARRILR